MKAKARIDRHAVIVGLMSGTSTDGVDAAVVKIAEDGGRGRIELLSFVTQPYTPQVRQFLLDLAGDHGRPSEVARANFMLGRLFAEAAARAISAAGLTSHDVAAVGCSGHTIAHLPHSGKSELEPPATMQIGEAAVIAERLGITVVSDFRVRDVAAGGQGAPLVPYFDYAFLSSPSINRAVLNIGGIANVTILPAGGSIDEIVAFDTGPGNMPIDIATQLATGGRLAFDRDGTIARSGRVDDVLIERLMNHPYFAQTPPKSCGREQFGEAFVKEIRRDAPDIGPTDLVATLTELTARTAAEAVRRFRECYSGPWELVVSGGGAHNPVLLESLARHAQMPVRKSDELGIPVDAKEAMAFAFLAWETLHGKPANVPVATGACGPRVLGKITPS